MTPSQLTDTVLRAVRRAVEDGELAAAAAESVASGRARVVVERPRPGGRGDWATNVALQLAGPAARPPRQIAETLRAYLDGTDGITDVAITGPGFLSISLGPSATTELVARIRREGPRYGHTEGSGGQPVHLRAAYEVRAVVCADAAARILRSQGTEVRTSCAAPPDPAWAEVLGAETCAAALPAPEHPEPPPTASGPGTDTGREVPGVREGSPLHHRSVGPDSGPDPGRAASGTPQGAAPAVFDIRPVPAPADPVPLGRDAGRWALLHPAGHDRPRVDDVHLAQREANPLFRVRYAHARTAALGRNAAALGFAAEPGDVPGQGALTGLLADHPRVLAAAARHRAPDRLARHLVEVADTFLADLHPGVLPVGGEKPSAAHRARLALAEATGTVLAGGLTLLGIDAPAHL